MAKEFIIKNGLIINGTQSVTGITTNSALTLNEATLVTQEAIKQYSDFYDYWNLNSNTLLPEDSNYSVEIENTDGSTSPTTGALVVNGGVGINENLYTAGHVDIEDDFSHTEDINGLLKVHNNSTSTSNNTAIGIWTRTESNSASLFVEGNPDNTPVFQMSHDTRNSDKSNGKLFVGGVTDEEIGTVAIYSDGAFGFGPGGDWYSGHPLRDIFFYRSTGETLHFTSDPYSEPFGKGNLVIQGNLTLDSGTTIYNISSDSGFTITDDNSIATNQAIKDYFNEYTYWSLSSDTLSPEDSNYSVEIENTTTSTSPTTGALVVNGGVGINDNLNLTNTMTIGSDGPDTYFDLLGDSSNNIRTNIDYADSGDFPFYLWIVNYDGSYDDNDAITAIRWTAIQDNNACVHLGGTKDNRFDVMPNKYTLPNGNNARTMIHVGLDDNVAYYKNSDAVMLRVKEYTGYGGQEGYLFMVDDGSSEFLTVHANGTINMESEVTIDGTLYANYSTQIVTGSTTLERENSKFVKQSNSGITTTLWSNEQEGDNLVILNRSGGDNTISGSTIEGSSTFTINDSESVSLIYIDSEWLIY